MPGSADRGPSGKAAPPTTNQRHETPKPPTSGKHLYRSISYSIRRRVCLNPTMSKINLHQTPHASLHPQKAPSLPQKTKQIPPRGIETFLKGPPSFWKRGGPHKPGRGLPHGCPPGSAGKGWST
jgi:hypothetical protein